MVLDRLKRIFAHISIVVQALLFNGVPVAIVSERLDVVNGEVCEVSLTKQRLDMWHACPGSDTTLNGRFGRRFSERSGEEGREERWAFRAH